MPLISIVVPCYNEQESLPIFLKELDGVVRIMTQQDPGISFEAVLIDDGSADKTLAVMKAEAAAAHPYAIRWHSFSRNFGKEAALLAGLQHAKGDYVATMDADMQDPPSLLPQMYEILQTEDYDNVATRRTTREGEPPIRSFCARMFYKIINRICLGRPRRRMAVARLPHNAVWRHAAPVPGNHWRIPGKSLLGNQATSHLYHSRIQRGIR